MGFQSKHLTSDSSGVIPSAGGVPPTIQKFLTGSGTYTRPSSPSAPIYLKVTMVGGGGGGGGAGGGATGQSGGISTFGLSLSAGGGFGGFTGASGGSGNSGGPASLGSAVGTALTGGSGLGGTVSTTSITLGGAGGVTAFGGQAISNPGGGGGVAVPNTGAGGNGGGGAVVGTPAGGGGGAGGYVQAFIFAPATSYTYAVGAAGTGGTGGGMTGGSGYIIVEEYYGDGGGGGGGNAITALTGDVSAAGPGSAFATIAAGAINNSKIATNALIQFSKLDALTSGQILVGNGSSIATAVAMTGDISLSNTGVTTYNGIVPITKGGTGGIAAGSIIIGGGAGVGIPLGIGTAGQVLTVAGGVPTWATGGGGGANTALSNLVSPTAVNQDLIFTKVPAAASFVRTEDGGGVNSQDLNLATGTSSASSGSVIVKSGIVTGNSSNPSGSLLLGSGNATGSSGNSGSVQLTSGTSTGASGAISIFTGQAPNPGNLLIQTGATTGTGTVSGTVTIKSGTATQSNSSSGLVLIQTSDAPGATGNIGLSTGNSTLTAGNSGGLSFNTGNTINGTSGGMSFFVGVPSGSGVTGAITMFARGMALGNNNGTISSPVASALLDLQSTTAALLLSRMNTTQRDALTKSSGMLIYNSQTNQFEGCTGAIPAWAALSGGGGGGITALIGDITASGSGTVSATYNGVVPINKGGTGQITATASFDALSPMTTLGDLIAGGTSGSRIRLGAGTTGQVLTIVGGVPAWAASGGGGGPTTLTGDVTGTGTGTVATTIAAGAVDNSKIAAGAAIAVSKLAALGSGQILVGNGSSVATAVSVTGAISIDNAGLTTYLGTVPINKGGTGAITAVAGFDALSPMTALGDMIVGSTGGSRIRLGIGTAGQVLTVSGGVPTWATSSGGGITALTGDVTASGTGSVTATYNGIVPIAKGGTGNVTAAAAFNALSPLTTTGDMLFFSGGSSRLPIGTLGQVLTVSAGGLPTWVTGGGGGGITELTGEVTAGPGSGSQVATIAALAVTNAKVATNAAIAFSKLAALASGQILVGNGSSVATAVAMTGAISIDNAGLTTYLGTVPINKGGTGQTTAIASYNALSPLTTTGDVLFFSGGSNTRLGIGTAGQVLTVSGGVPIWATSGSGITQLTGDVTAGPGSGIQAATIAAGAVDNSKIAAGAAIAFSKLAALSPGQILVGNGSSIATAVAMTGDISISNAGVTAYVTTMPIAKGGTGQTTAIASFNALSPLTTAGDILFFSGGSNSRLGIGTAGQVLTVSGGVPVWAAGGGGGGITALTGDVTASGTGSVVATIAAGAVDNSRLAASAVDNAKISAGAAIAFSKLAALGSGQILVGSAGLVVTAVTMTGDISLSNTGVTTYNGIVPIAKGGTGATSKASGFDALSPMTTLGDIIIGGAAGTGGRLGIGTAGQVLTVSGGVPTWAASGGGGGSTGYTVRQFTFANGHGTIVAFGSATDVNNIVMTFTAPNSASITNVTGTAQLMGASLQYDININTTTSFALAYPEINGQTSITATKFPMQYRFNSGGSNQPTANTVTNSGGVVTVTTTGMTANAAQTFTWNF